MCVLVYLQSTAVLSWMVGLSAPGRVARRLSRAARIVGDEWCYTQEHQLRTYESDGLLQYHAMPTAAVLPGTTEEVQGVVRPAPGRACRGWRAARARASPAAPCR